MKKVIIFLAAMAMMTACSSDLEYTKPDNITEEIVFSVGDVNMTAANAVSRAGEHNHKAWNDAVHANTLGVFGYGDGNTSNVMFNNQKVTYADSKWGYTPERYWPEFTQYSSFYFFGYMVENADPAADPMPAATVTKAGNDYTLSFPYTISAPVLASGDNTPLICHEPKYMTAVGDPVSFEMDQTLTGYDIQFQLGEEMDALRHFVIKSVKIYGENLPIGGTVKRKYTFNAGTWTVPQDLVRWDVANTVTLDDEHAIEIAEGWKSEPMSKRTVDTHTEWVKWGGDGLADGAFFAIPHESFQPTIEVIYDVYTDTDGNGDGDTLDRKNVKSVIVFNNDNFGSTVGTTGEINHIRIKIVPRFLYVMSDDDQIMGLLIDTPTP